MRCPKCQSTSIKERPERTAQGYRRFRCLGCAKQFNERSTSLLNRTQYRYVDETYIRVHGRWKYLYRAIDRDGALVDVMLSEHRDLAAAKAFFQSAKAVTGVVPDRVTTDGHDAYPRAIGAVLGKDVRHRTNIYLNNRLEQDHRGIKGRCRPMLGFKSARSAKRYCRGHDELRNFLRCRSYMCQHIPASTRRFHHMRRTAIALGILEAA